MSPWYVTSLNFSLPQAIHNSIHRVLIPIFLCSALICSCLQDSPLWQLIAYCAGTGGSLLVIGSAAGVALMGMEKVDFLWYFKRITASAFVGYMGGIGTYLALKYGLGGSAVAAVLPAISGVVKALPFGPPGV